MGRSDELLRLAFTAGVARSGTPGISVCTAVKGA